jgi:hypothetical protein
VPRKKTRNKLRESKRLQKAELIRRGTLMEFDDLIEELKAKGATPGEARAEAIKEFLKGWNPKPPTEVPPHREATKEEKKDIREEAAKLERAHRKNAAAERAKQEVDKNIDVLFDGKRSTLTKDVRWVYENIELDEVNMEDCPSSGAYGLWQWARLPQNKGDFYRSIWSKLLPSKAVIDSGQDPELADEDTSQDFLDGLIQMKVWAERKAGSEPEKGQAAEAGAGGSEGGEGSGEGGGGKVARPDGDGIIRPTPPDADEDSDGRGADEGDPGVSGGGEGPGHSEVLSGPEPEVEF